MRAPCFLIKCEDGKLKSRQKQPICLFLLCKSSLIFTINKTKCKKSYKKRLHKEKKIKKHCVRKKIIYTFV